jgi:hypothetical protein
VRAAIVRLCSSALAVAVLAACSSAAAPSSPTAGETPVPSPLAAGTYTSKLFQPAATYTIPDGWDNPDDSPTYFRIRPVGSEVVGIDLFRDPLPASQDASCPETAAPGVGSSSLQLATWMRGLPGLVVSEPKLVEVGGLRGTRLEMSIRDGWKTSCPFASGLPTVPLFVGPKGEYRWVVVGNERLRLDLLDVPGGGTVVVDVDAFEGSLYDQLVAAAQPIVQSLRFALG